MLGNAGWIVFTAIVIAIFLDWLWVFKLRKLKKKPQSQASLSNDPENRNKFGRKFTSFSPSYLATAFVNFYRRYPWLAVPLVLISAYLAYLAQKGLLVDHVKEPGIWYLLGSGVLFVIALLVIDFPDISAANGEVGVSRLVSSPILRRILLAISILIAVANAFLLLSRQNGSSYWDIFTLWIASIFLFLLPFCHRPILKLPALHLKDRWIKILPLAIILLAGFAVRFYQLGLIPFIMENDEAIDGVAALKVLNGSLTNMFQTSGGNGTLLYFIMALQVKIFGQTQLALRIGTAAIGFLTLVVIYVLARRLFGQKAALASTALAAVSHLLIHFSRVSPTSASLDPLLASLSFLLVYYGLQTRRTFHLILAGIVMGFGLYCYVGARVLIFVFAAFILLLWITNRPILRENWRGLLALAAAYLLVAVPMLVWSLANPSVFNARANQMGIFQNGWLVAEAVRQDLPVWNILWQQFSNAFLTFNFYRPDWFYQAAVPALGPLTGVLFIVGLVISFFHLRDLRFGLLSCWLWITLILGQVLVVNSATSAYRTLGLMPAVMILAGLALVRLADGFFLWWPKVKRFAPVALVALALIFEAGWNIWNYFGVWAVELRYSDQISRMASLIGDFMGQQPPGTTVYFAPWPDFITEKWSAIEYKRRSTLYTEIKEPVADAIPNIHLDGQTVFIFPPKRTDELPTLIKAFPGGKTLFEYLGDKLYFTAYIR